MAWNYEDISKPNISFYFNFFNSDKIINKNIIKYLQMNKKTHIGTNISISIFLHTYYIYVIMNHDIKQEQIYKTLM